MKTEWFCPKCKLILTFDIDVAEQDFRCKCGHRQLLPVRKEEKSNASNK